MTKPRKIFIYLFVLLLTYMTSELAKASGSSIWSGYNLGITYEGTARHAEIIYDTPATKDTPEDCVPNDERQGVFRCTAYLGPDGDGSKSIGAFLEAPFKRQGFFYFDGGLTFSTISYKGGLISKPSSPTSSVRGTKTNTLSRSNTTTQPLTNAYLEFYGINWQGYIRFGITPRYLPDILISLGGGVQTATGKVRLFKESYTRNVIQPEVFGIAEIVALRIGTGSLSMYVSQDQSFVSQLGTNLVDDNPSGTELSNIRLGLSASASGLRLLFPF